MSEETRIAAARIREERTMIATCRITREILDPASIDTETGAIDLTLRDTDPDDDDVWQGICKVRAQAAPVFMIITEGQTIAAQHLVLSVPIAGTASIRINDKVEILDGGDDPDLAGQEFYVRGFAAGIRTTARRFPVEHRA